MTLRTPAFNDAKQYGFEYLRHLAETLLNSEGVANYATDMVVTNAATGLRVDIAAGAAWVKGDSGTPGMGISQGLYSVVNDAAVANAVTLPAAHASNPRLDQIVLKVRDSSDLGSGADDAIFDYVQGTATAGATLLNRTGAAALPNDCLRLADVLVPAAATNLTAANVRDRRIPANGRATRSVPTAESTSSTTYTDLATPELIEVYVPDGASVAVGSFFLGKHTVNIGYRALFITDMSTMTATQLKTPQVDGAPTAQYGLIQGTFYAEGGGGFANSADSTLVTTGLTGFSVSGGIHGLPAGLYSFSYRYKAAASGTVTAKDRRMAVQVIGNGRSQ